MRYSGTGFGIKSPGLVLTASHCLGNAKGPDEVYLGARDGGFLPASCMKRHPEADIAALVFEADRAPSCFELGEPPENDGEFYMGTEISSYGYPSREGGPDKTILEPRLMRGHIQRNFQYEWGDLRRRYHAFELSFPVLPGQSGSPVFLDHEIRSTIAVLTTSFESSVVIDMYEEENQKNGENEIHKTSKSSLTGSGRRFGDMRTGYVREQARTVPDGLKVDEYFAAQEERSKSEGAVKKDETESGSTSPEGITAGAAAPSPP